MNLETKITIYKFTPQLFTLTHNLQVIKAFRHKKKRNKVLTSFLLLGDPPGARTQDPNIKSVVLYLLS